MNNNIIVKKRNPALRKVANIQEIGLVDGTGQCIKATRRWRPTAAWSARRYEPAGAQSARRNANRD